MTNKVFCDKCGKEIEQNRITIIEWAWLNEDSHICEKCEKFLLEWLDVKVTA
jgi:hypothetical protein